MLVKYLVFIGIALGQCIQPYNPMLDPFLAGTWLGPGCEDEGRRDACGRPNAARPHETPCHLKPRPCNRRRPSFHRDSLIDLQ